MSRSTQIKPSPHSTSHAGFPRLSRRVHGVIDYVLAICAAASPWIFGFAYEQPHAANIGGIVGTAIIVYSLLTDYEMGLLRVIPFAGHRFFDLVSGVMLLGALWHFDMKGITALVFGVLGFIQIATVFLTPRPVGSVNTM